MALINTAPTAALGATYNALVKYVAQYIESGMLRSKFDWFLGEDVQFGGGVETNVVLSATANSTETRLEEHGTYTPTVMTVIVQDTLKNQYGVTVDYEKLQKCVGDEEKIRVFAAELTDSLYQGFIDDKNAAIMTALTTVQTGTKIKPTVTIVDSVEVYATNLLTAVKTNTANLKEGITGTSYGNTFVANKRIACARLAMIMSNETAAMLDTWGFARAFHDDYLKENGIERIATNRMAENTVLITDVRNIAFHKRRETFVDIENSDGSQNLFLNEWYFLGARYDSTKAYNAYPSVLITGVEAGG